MKKILIFGMMDTVGGIESYILGLLKNIDVEEYNFDFLSKGIQNFTYQEEIKKISPKSKFYFIPKYSQNPVKSVKTLVDIFKTNKYDIVYMNSGFSSDMLFVAPYVDNNTKIIVHSHMSFSDISTWRTVLFRNYLNVRANIKLACSTKAAEWLYGKKEISKGKVKIIKNGIDTTTFRFNENDRKIIRKQYGLDDNEILIGHVGRFVPTKNHYYLIEILKKILNVEPRVRLMLIGDGPLKNEIVEKISSENLEKSVIIAGIKSDIHRYYSAFDVFVLPSVHEGFPLTGVEAQSMGLVSLFSNSIDDSIVLTDKAQMLPITKDSLDSWVQCILNVSKYYQDDRAQYSRIVSKAGYDIKDVADTIVKLFDKE